MEDQTLYKIIINDCLIHINRVKMIKIKCDHFILSWSIDNSSSELCIHQIKKKTFYLNSDPDENLFKKNFSLSERIVDVISTQDVELIFLVNGLMYQIDTVLRYDEEMLFDTPSNAEEEIEFQLIAQNQLKECDEIIAVCPTGNGFAAFVTKGEHFFLQTYILGDMMAQHVIPLQLSHQTKAVLHSCLAKQISKHLRKYLFPGLDVLEEEIVLVGLSTGLVAWFSPCSPGKGIQTICCTLQPVKLFYWISDTSNECYTGLLIILDNGLVTAITVNQEGLVQSNNLCLPGDVKSVECSGDKIVISDGIVCSLCHLCMGDTLSIQSSTLPIKGVRCICKDLDSDAMILATSHQTVYSLNTCLAPTGNPKCFVMPDQSLLTGIMHNVQQLDKVTKLSEREDLIMQALATSSIVNSMSDLFKISVKAYPGEKITVTINMASDSFIISSELWKLQLELSDGHSLLTKLTQDFTHQAGLVVDMFCTVTAGCELICSLVAFIEDKLVWPIIHLGKELIDASYLLEPINMLQSGYAMLVEPTSQPKYEDCVVLMKIPEYIKLNSFYTTILQNVHHRIPEEILNDDKRLLHAKLGNSVITFSLDEQKSTLTISSSNVDACHLVKSAVARKFSKEVDKIVDVNLLLETQNLQQMLDLLRLNTSPERNEILKIKQRMRNEVSSQFNF